MIKQQIFKQIRSIVKSSVVKLNRPQQLESSDDIESSIFSTLESSMKKRPKLKLIADVREYREAFLDRYIAWILTHDPDSPFKSESLLKANYDIEVFSQRIADLDLEYHQYRQQRVQQYRTDLRNLDARGEDVNIAGRPAHQAQQLIEAAHAARNAEVITNYEEDLAALDREYAIVKEQCQSRINDARNYLN
jgi:hypothetical protein